MDEEKKRAEARQQEESLSGLPATADENPEMGKRPAEVEVPAEVQGPTLEWIAFRLLVTPEQKQELKQWILRNQINLCSEERVALGGAGTGEREQSN